MPASIGRPNAGRGVSSGPYTPLICETFVRFSRLKPSRALRASDGGAGFDVWVTAGRLLKNLAPLDDRLWLVVDDVQELGPDALALELLIMRYHSQQKGA